MEEKRKFVRAPLVVKVTNRRTQEFHFFYSRDISLGGIFLETRDPYPAGTEVELDFFLQISEHKERVVIIGAVMRVQPFDVNDKDGPTPGMGVEFKSVDPKLLAMVGNYIRDILGVQ